MRSRPWTAAALAVLAATGCDAPDGARGRNVPATGQDRVRVEVGVRPFLTNAPLYIAAAEHDFQEAGLDVRFRMIPTSYTAYLTTLENGQLDVLAGAPSIGLFNAIARGAGVRIVADKGHLAPGRCSPSGIVTRRDAVGLDRTGDPAALRGRTIDVNPMTPRGYYLDTFLHHAGLSLADIDARTFPTAARPEALRTGAVDATATSEPWITRLLQAGHTLFEPANEIIPGFPMGVLLLGPRLLEEDREAGARFVAAYLRGVARYHEGRTARNVEILARATGLDPETLDRICWPSVRADGIVDTAAIRRFQEWARDRGMLDRVVAPEEYMDPELARRAVGDG